MNLICFCLCSNISSNFGGVFHFLCFSYLGQQIYKQALQYHKIILKQNAAASLTTRSSLSAANRSSSPGKRVQVKFKIATCRNSLNEHRAALAEMEGIPIKSRNLEMNLMMAKLYRNSRPAIGCFKECLRNCPYELDAIIALAELFVSAKDIISLFPQGYSNDHITSNSLKSIDSSDKGECVLSLKSSKYITGLVRSYLALSKIKEALYVAREAMKAMPQSAKALKLVGDAHASSTCGREKAKSFMNWLSDWNLVSLELHWHWHWPSSMYRKAEMEMLSPSSSDI